MSAASAEHHRTTIAALADQCVKCGLCLPHCPTYLDTQQEGDSPRGRIALLQALALGRIQPTARLEIHLDGCLSCRACEVVCPANVAYGELLDAGREELASNRPRRLRRVRLIGLLLTRRWGLTLLKTLLGLYRRSGLQALLRRSGWLRQGRLARLESLLPDETPAIIRSPLPDPASAVTVNLFEGCVTCVIEYQALDAAEVLLRAAGLDVRRPRRQTCCGALYQHAGATAQAQALAGRNVRAFAGDAPIVGSASGCSATLLDYGRLAGEEGADFAARVEDFGELLLRHAGNLRFAPLPARVAIHTPCTQRNVLKRGDSTQRLLALIPQLQVIELDPVQHCCGAAGLHFITDPQAADRLLQRKLDAVAQLRPDFIVSTNVGCTLHLAGGLRRSAATASASPPVRHPALLLAQQLQP